VPTIYHSTQSDHVPPKSTLSISSPSFYWRLPKLQNDIALITADTSTKRVIAAYVGEKVLRELLQKMLQSRYPELPWKSYEVSGAALQFLFKSHPF